MNKHTANSMQFINRVGNSSTKPSARGVNLLGWGEAEGELSAQEQIDCLRRKVAALQGSLNAASKKQRAEIGRDIAALNLRIHALKGDQAHKGRDLSNYLCDVIKESVPRLTWERYVKEARERQRLVEAPVSTTEKEAE